MNQAEREAFKDQLRLMADGHGSGIDLDSVDRWVIRELKDPGAFFRHLGVLIPADSILYIESQDTAPEAARFYAEHRAANPVPVVRDAIYPVPEIFHVALAAGVTEGLARLTGQYQLERCLGTVKAYQEGRLLFTFHDAFDGSDLLVSDRIPEEHVRAFCAVLGANCQREPNVNQRDPEQLRRFLWAMENPHKLRMNWPWWKKALLFWKR